MGEQRVKRKPRMLVTAMQRMAVYTAISKAGGGARRAPAAQLWRRPVTVLFPCTAGRFEYATEWNRGPRRVTA